LRPGDEPIGHEGIAIAGVGCGLQAREPIEANRNK
jgi:hypothetical protein